MDDAHVYTRTQNTIHKNPLIFLFVLFVGILIAIGAYSWHKESFLQFSPLTTLSYDTNKAQQLLQDPQTIVFTRANSFYLNNLKGDEVSLIGNEHNQGTKVKNIRISQSRNYIAWMVENETRFLDVKNRTIVVVHKGSKAVFDLSPAKDSMLLMYDDTLYEVNLSDGFIRHRQHFYYQLQTDFHHIYKLQYSPDGMQAYLFHADTSASQRNDMVLIDLVSQSTYAVDSNLVVNNFFPVWSKDSNTLLLYYNNHLYLYTVVTKQSADVFDAGSFSHIWGASFRPNTDGILFYGLKSPEQYQSSLFLQEANVPVREVISGKDTSLSRGISSTIFSVGFVNDTTAWIMYAPVSYNVRDVWTIDTKGGNLMKTVTQITQSSLDFD